MGQSRHKAKRWIVRQQFEPDRMSRERLADAYEQVIPKCVRVIGATKDTARAQHQTERQRAKEA